MVLYSNFQLIIALPPPTSRFTFTLTDVIVLYSPNKTLNTVNDHKTANLAANKLDVSPGGSVETRNRAKN